MMVKKRGQIWVETVIYTLIGLALIGLVLAIVTPKINEQRDRIIVEQTIDSMSVFDEKINEVLYSVPGNVRNIPAFSMKRGELYINSSADKIVFVLKGLSKPYSEPGVAISFGNVIIFSEEKQRTSSVYLTLDYTNVANLTYQGEEKLKKFTIAATPYKFSIENKGNNNVDIKEIS